MTALVSKLNLGYECAGGSEIKKSVVVLPERVDVAVNSRLIVWDNTRIRVWTWL